MRAYAYMDWQLDHWEVEGGHFLRWVCVMLIIWLQVLDDAAGPKPHTAGAELIVIYCV